MADKLNFDRLGYDEKEFFPRDTVNYRISGTQTSTTNEWKGNLPEGVASYGDGLTIDYFLPYPGTPTAATLTLSPGTAKPVYCLSMDSLTPVTTQIPAKAVVRLTYIVDASINSGNGAWLAIGDWSPNQQSSLNVTTDTVSKVAVTAGSAPSLVTTSVSCDDITNWNSGSMFSASISQGELTLTAGSAPALSYESRTVGSVSSWNAGSATTVTDTPTTVVTSVSVIG